MTLKRLPLSEGVTGWTEDSVTIHDDILQWVIDTERPATNFDSSSSMLSPCCSFCFLLPPPYLPTHHHHLIPHLAWHFHGLGDCCDSLSAVRVGTGTRAGPIHGARTCQGGCSWAGQSGHTGRRHWQAEKGSFNVCERNTRYMNVINVLSWCKEMLVVHANMEN